MRAVYDGYGWSFSHGDEEFSSEDITDDLAHLVVIGVNYAESIKDATHGLRHLIEDMKRWDNAATIDRVEAILHNIESSRSKSKMHIKKSIGPDEYANKHAYLKGLTCIYIAVSAKGMWMQS